MNYNETSHMDYNNMNYNHGQYPSPPQAGDTHQTFMNHHENDNMQDEMDPNQERVLNWLTPGGQSFPGQQTGFPGHGQPGGFPGGPWPGQGHTGGPHPGGTWPGQPSFPGQPGGPQHGQPGGPHPSQPGGTAVAPTTPPPNFTPQQPTHQAFAIDSGAIRGCRFRFTYIWLNRDSFWFFPTFVGRNSVAGFRWSRNRWVYFGIDLNRIVSFQCF
ncbi:hypothetical protein ACFFIS_14635 [Virgibacillus soli]|uniref:Transporter n=1 Tax=Paracerasibacillus soli TaxID=480284 RepID=A0ABU5CXV7_9BACI|nr:hypothetical protein [Virgibacillus soli]MDY0410305.1 hypothetical protein [Virgibacillus soli]